MQDLHENLQFYCRYSIPVDYLSIYNTYLGTTLEKKKDELDSMNGKKRRLEGGRKACLLDMEEE